MTEPRDEFDDWLARDVQPLPPPPGTFERISRRARRRKLNQALLTGGAAVLVLAGGVLIPAAATGLLSGPAAPQPAAASGPERPASPSSAPATTSPASPSPTAPTAAAGSALSATTSGDPVPSGFQPTSITMIGTSIGAVIGQAGVPGHCGPPVAADCTSLAGTSDYGSTWYGVSAPVTSGPDGATGVSQLRFLNLTYGWAYGPALYATSDGGRTWTRVATGGQRVTALEAAGDRAFAVLATCSGTGADYQVGCTSFALYSMTAGSTTLAPVPVSAPAGTLSAGGLAASAALAIAGDAADPEQGTGYLLTPSGAILRGSVGGGAWRDVGTAPCAPGATGPTGAPARAQLSIGAGGALLESCVTPTGGSALFTSADGATWTAAVSHTPAAGTITALAGTSAQVLLATTQGLLYAPSPAGPWRAAAVTGGTPAGGFAYVGMTSGTQGVALPADPALGVVYISRDGGQTWVPHRVSG